MAQDNFNICILTKGISDYVNQLVVKLTENGFKNITIVEQQYNISNLSQITLKLYYQQGFIWIFKKIFTLIKSYIVTILLPKNFEKIYVDQVNEYNDLEKTDICVSYNTGILKEKIINTPKYGVICAHPALLPLGRGFDGVYQAVLNGDKIGVTVFKIDEGIDTGDIYLQEVIDQGRLYSSDHLKNIIKEVSLNLTVDVIKGISSEKLLPKKQKQKLPYKKLTEPEKEMAQILLEKIFVNNRSRLKSH